MKRFLLASAATALLSGAASAADLPRRAEPPPVFTPVPVFTWTGIYIGTHTTYTFSDDQRIRATGNDAFGQAVIAAGVVPSSVKSEVSGFGKFGGGFGINYQLTPGSGFVIGAAFDGDWIDIHKNSFVLGNPTPAAFGGIPAGVTVGSTYFQGLDWLFTANGRLGYAFDRFLVYGTAGAAIGRVDYAVNGYLTNGTQVFTGSGGAFEVGFNYGGGIEYALTPDSFLGNLSVLRLLGINLGGTTTLKAEYIRYDLGSQRFLVGDTVGIGTTSTVRVHSEGSMVRAGFTYKFP